MRCHADDLRAEVADSTVADAVEADWSSAPLEEISPRARALCLHAEKLTRTPQEVSVQDIDVLREAGLEDEEIHDLTQVVALFNYYNRLAEGLGIDKEELDPKADSANES